MAAAKRRKTSAPAKGKSPVKSGLSAYFENLASALKPIAQPFIDDFKKNGPESTVAKFIKDIGASVTAAPTAAMPAFALYYFPDAPEHTHAFVRGSHQMFRTQYVALCGRSSSRQPCVVDRLATPRCEKCVAELTKLGCVESNDAFGGDATCYFTVPPAAPAASTPPPESWLADPPDVVGFFAKSTEIIDHAFPYEELAFDGPRWRPVSACGAAVAPAALRFGCSPSSGSEHCEACVAVLREHGYFIGKKAAVFVGEALYTKTSPTPGSASAPVAYEKSNEMPSPVPGDPGIPEDQRRKAWGSGMTWDEYDRASPLHEAILNAMSTWDIHINTSSTEIAPNYERADARHASIILHAVRRQLGRPSPGDLGYRPSR